MQSRRGIPVSPGIAIAKAVVLDNDEHTVPKRHITRDKLQAEHDLVGSKSHETFTWEKTGMDTKLKNDAGL